MNKNMNDADFQKLIENSWRRGLTAEEQALLATHLTVRPEMRESWQEEAALNNLLRRMPTAAVSTNFTARVLNAARNAPVRHGRGLFLWLPVGWLPRTALAMAMLGCGLFTFHEYQTFHRQQLFHEQQLARDVVRFSRLASLPLEDFDTIDRMSKVTVADDELLTSLE